MSNASSDSLDAPRLLDTFLTLVRFNTPSRQERAASEWAGERLRRLGFSVAWDEAGERVGGTVGNLIAFKSGTLTEAPAVFFSAHLDTVEPTPDLQVEVEGDVIRSVSDTILGADDKCGVAPILEAMESLVASGEPHGDIQILFTICEEIGLVGAKSLDPARIRARFGFVLDSTPPVGEITRAAPSQNSIKVRIAGQAAHAGVAPERGVSAIAAAAHAISSMRLGRIDAETTANVGTIAGGTARNVVPAECLLVCEARSRDHAKLSVQTQHMKETFERAAAERGARAEVEVVEEYRAYRLADDDPVVRVAVAAAEAAGLAPALRESGGGSDANIFNAQGIPTVVLATGMEKIHTHGEFCRLSDMLRNARWVREIVRRVARGGG